MKIWTFAIKKDFYFELHDSEEITWNSAKEVKKDDIIFVYTGSPYSSIEFILKSLTNPFEDKRIREKWNQPAIKIEKVLDLPKPILLQELRNNPILNNWGAVKMGFRGSHFKMSKEEYDELKYLILEKNPELQNEISQLESNLSKYEKLKQKAKTFKENFKEEYKDLEDIYDEFINLYPFKEHPEKIDSITSEDIYNPGKKPYFLYYIERKLPGSLRVGNANFAVNARNQIWKFKELLHIAVDDSVSIAEKVDAPWQDINYWGGDKHIAKKIIYSYNPKKILPTFKTEHLEHFVKELIGKEFRTNPNKYKKPYDNLSLGEKFEYLNDILINFKDNFIDPEMDNLSFGWFLYDYSHPDLAKDVVDVDYYDLNAGRAHIVRDICYLISEYDFSSEDELFNKVREKIGDNTDYWKAYYQQSTNNTSPAYNLNSARTLHLINNDELKLTAKGKELTNVVNGKELFTYDYSLNTKKFFFMLALENPSIKTAMNILREKRKLRFYSPTCTKTNKVAWSWKMNKDQVECEEDKEEQCQNCNKDLKTHLKESSLPFETLIKTGGEGSGLVFWICSRVTPMHLTGTKPTYKGKHIIWDEKSEEELGDLVDLLNDDIHTFSQRIWKITPGNNLEINTLWPLYRQNGFIGIGWLHSQRDYLEFKSLDDIKTALLNFYDQYKTEDAATQSAKMIWDFTNSIRKNDLVIANGGMKKVLGIGIIKSSYIGPNNPENPHLFDYFEHLRKVDWLITDEIELDDYFFDRKTVTKIGFEKWEKIKNTYLTKFPNLREIFYEIENLNVPAANTDNLIPKNIQISLRNLLEVLLKYYKPAKQDKLSSDDQKRVKDILGVQLPNLLKEETNDKYKIFSSAWDKWHYCPYVTLIDKKVDTNHADRILVNYILREDTSGLYLSIRQRIHDISQDGYEKLLKSNTESLRNKNKSSKFTDQIDLKADQMSYAPFYEAGTLYSKLYELNNLPSEEEFKKDLNDILKLYDEIVENKFLKLLKEIYNPEIQIAVGELKRGKNIIFYGPPGSGKTVLSKIISEKYRGENAYSLYTVHSGTDYYDLVSRIIPQINDDGNLIYRKEARFLLDALLSRKILILDEINRTQIDTAFGIFFTYLERDHRLNDAKQITNILEKELDQKLDLNEFWMKLADFRVIGTLNVYDKTFLFKLGDALKRRFTFIEITTNDELLNRLNILSFQEEFIDICDFNGEQAIATTIINVFSELNHVKPLGIGVLKEALQFSVYFPTEAADTTVSSVIIPFFENDFNYTKIKAILENYNLKISLNKLNSLNFGASDINGLK